MEIEMMPLAILMLVEWGRESIYIVEVKKASKNFPTEIRQQIQEY